MDLPLEFTARMSRLLPDYDKFLAAYSDAPVAGVRANTLKISPEGLKLLMPELGCAVDWCETGFYYGEGLRPGKSPYYHAGLYYIQEPSAMSPVSVLGVRPGQKVLDLCAAPGGKSTQIAARLGGGGVLVSNDISASRARALLKNIELSGAANCVVTNEAPERLASRFAGYFDRVLADAPCSGEGMFRKDPDARKAWAARKPETCRAAQRESLRFAAAMTRPGGRLVYSTCTFAPEENEMMVAEFLSRHGDFEGEGIPRAALGLSPGLDGGGHTARIFPHRQKGEGHFIACLRRKPGGGGSEASPASPRGAKAAPLAKLPPEYSEFCEKYLTFAPQPVTRRGNSLHISPPQLDFPGLGGLRVLREGLYLGEVRTKRFEPSQALAMAMRPGGARHCVDFPFDPGDPGGGLFRYLKGESFELPDQYRQGAADGWCLVSVGGFPLGWAKAAGGRLKNKYPKGWLMN